MSDYTQTVYFGPKDSLTTGDPLKLIKGTQVDAELLALSNSIASKVDKSGGTLTGALTVVDSLTVDDATPTITVGTTTTGAGAASIEIGKDRTTDGKSFLDLVGDTTYNDYGLRLIRNETGANANSELIHHGTGSLIMQTTEAGDFKVNTTGTTRFTITAAGAATFTGAVNTGALTSTGIDDNATAERLQLADAALQIGSSTATSAYLLQRPITDGTLELTGSNGTDLGGNVVLYGDGHGSKAGDIELRQDSTTRMQFDNSATAWLYTAELNLQDNALRRGKLVDYSEVVNDIGSTGGGTQDIDLELGNVVLATVDTSTNTFTFSNPIVTGSASSFSLLLTNGGSQTVVWPATVDWAAATAPTLTASGLDLLVFTTVDGGTIWHGVLASEDSS